MSPVITNLLLKSLAETLYMLSISAFIAAAAGIPLGILLVVTEKMEYFPARLLISHWLLSLMLSVPFPLLFSW